MRLRSKVDANQKQIVKVLRGMGAFVLMTHQIKNAFDCIAFYKGHIFIIEIKDGSKYESQRRLTPGEYETMTSIVEQQCDYHIIESVDQAINLLNSTVK